MFTFNGRDAHRNLTPSRVHLPFQRTIGEILPDRQKTEDDDVRPELYYLLLSCHSSFYVRLTLRSCGYLHPACEEHGQGHTPCSLGLYHKSAGMSYSEREARCS